MTAVSELDQQRTQYKDLIERRDLALALERVPAFKKLILDYFCVEQCARYAQNSADPALGPEEQADSLAMAQAAGHLRRFLSVTVQRGNWAESELEELEQAIIDEASEQED